MSRLRLFLVSSLLLLGFALSAREQALAAGPYLPSRRALARYGLVMAWANHATINPHRDTVAHLTADEEVTFVQTTAGTVTGFDNATGRRLWTVQLGRRDEPSFALASNDDLALVVKGLTLFAIDKHQGGIEWQVPVPSYPSAGPAVDMTQVYVGAVDGSLYAFDLMRTRSVYEEGLLPRWSYKTINWQYRVGAAITQSPLPAVIEVGDPTGESTVRQHLLNVASSTGSLYSFSSDQRRLRFHFETDARLSTELTQAGDYLYFADENYNVYCVNINTGAVRWEFATDKLIRQPARIVAGQCFWTTDRGGMICVDAETGVELWRNPHAASFVAASFSQLYASDPTGALLILRKDNGAVLGSLPLRQFNVRLSNERTDRLILATSSGLVVNIHELDRTTPLYHKYPERSPISPEFAEEQADQPKPDTEASEPDAAPAPPE